MKTFKSMIALVLIAFCLLAAGCNQEVVETVVCTETVIESQAEVTETLVIEEVVETTVIETSTTSTTQSIETTVEETIPLQSSNFCEVVSVETSVCGYPLTTESTTNSTEATATTTAGPTNGPTPDTSVLWGDQVISEYYVEGYGTVYGFFTDTSGFNNQVQQHLAEIGVAQYPTCNTDEYTRTRAIECTVSFSHVRPNGQRCGIQEICTNAGAGGAFEAFRTSPEHWAHIEAGADAEVTNLSSASFTRVGWYPDGSGGYGWQMDGGATVAHI